MHYWDPWDSGGTHVEGFSQILMFSGFGRPPKLDHFCSVFFLYTDLL